MKKIPLLLLAALAAAAPAHASLKRSLPDGSIEYLTRYEEEGKWNVVVTRESGSGFPDVVSEANGLSLVEMKRAISDWREKEPGARLGGGSLLRLKPEETQVSGAIWKATNAWSWEWEKKYAEWVERETDPTFLKRHGIASDCADVAYAYRWIFSRINGLPAAGHLMGSGKLFTHETVLAQWKRLGTSEDWAKDRRFRAALEYVLKLTYTHTLARDSYPIAITPEAFLEGTVHLELHDGSGHTRVMWQVNLEDETGVPVLFVQSTTPRSLRVLDPEGFWYGSRPVKDEGGIIRFRWPEKSAGKWELRAAETMPFYSTEQYAVSSDETQGNFAMWVLKKLIPGLDLGKRLRAGVEDFKKQLKNRIELVEQGYEACRRGCPEGSSGYDSWSTPSRDARLVALLKQIEDLANQSGQIDPELPAFWEALQKEGVVALEGTTYPFDLVSFVLRTGWMSSNPNDPPALRWALSPEAFVQTAGSKLKAALLERGSLVRASSACRAKPSECVPGSKAWVAGDSMQVDFRAQSATSQVQFYLGYAPESLRERHRRAKESFELEVSGKRLRYSEWADALAWFVSDPRASERVRWGQHRADYSHQVFHDITGGSQSLNGFLLGDATGGDGKKRLLRMRDGSEVELGRGAKPVSIDPSTGLVVVARGCESKSCEYQVWDPERQVSILERSYPGSRSGSSVQFVWYSPGVLVAQFANRSELLDLRDGRAEVHSGLPSSPFFEGGVVHANVFMKDSGEVELIRLERDGLVRRTIDWPFPEGMAPRGLVDETENEWIGRTKSVSDGDDSVGGRVGSEQRFFAIDKRTFQVRPLWGGRAKFLALTADAKHAVFYLDERGGPDDRGPWVRFVELGPDFSIGRIELTVTGYLGTVRRERDELCVGVRMQASGPDGGSTTAGELFRYRGGQWEKSSRLGDETSIDVRDGEWLLATTGDGNWRLRRWGSHDAQIERPNGDGLVGTALDSRGELTAVGTLGWFRFEDAYQPLGVFVAVPFLYDVRGQKAGAPMLAAQLVETDHVYADGSRVRFPKLLAYSAGGLIALDWAR